MVENRTETQIVKEARHLMLATIERLYILMLEENQRPVTHDSFGGAYVWTLYDIEKLAEESGLSKARVLVTLTTLEVDGSIKYEFDAFWERCIRVVNPTAITFYIHKTGGKWCEMEKKAEKEREAKSSPSKQPTT